MRSPIRFRPYLRPLVWGGRRLGEVLHKPLPTGEQVLIKVRAACLNRADLGMARGRTHGSRGGTGSTLGGEGAGEVGSPSSPRQ